VPASETTGRDRRAAGERRPRRSAAATREHLLETATELFYWEGIHRTGVDRVAERAGVGPTTLYRAFASKDDLVAAYVERAAAGYRELIDEVTAVGTPRERVLALFDATLDGVRPEASRGCPFLMALAELPDPGTPAHAAAVAVKAYVRTRLQQLAKEMGAPEALGDQLALVLEGIYGSVQALTAGGPAQQARAAAEALIASAAPEA
jgi:AcrR family transcriptional regulator